MSRCLESINPDSQVVRCEYLENLEVNAADDCCSHCGLARVVLVSREEEALEIWFS